jgi:hypothetical protein
MKLLKLAAIISAFYLSGCATVPTETAENAAIAKEFSLTSQNNAGIYVYRVSTPFGAALKKDIWVNDECLGQSASGVFFYKEVEGDKEHIVATESEFSANEIALETESGKMYFVEQYLKMGAFVGGAGLEYVSSEKGKKEVMKLDMAVPGGCDSPVKR